MTPSYSGIMNLGTILLVISVRASRFTAPRVLPVLRVNVSAVVAIYLLCSIGPCTRCAVCSAVWAVVRAVTYVIVVFSSGDIVSFISIFRILHGKMLSNLF